jgi:CDP-glycerol glycerophosphotransferase (TagB/SpsB family)
VTTSPFRFDEPAIMAAAKRQGIPTISFITSWDNLSTKNRMQFRSDAFLVWSQKMKDELLEYYPYARDVPIYIVGVPQFDVFYQPRFHVSRAEYCKRQGLDPARKIVLYALGSPNMIREHHGAIDMAGRVARGELGDVQLLVRPHPNFDKSDDIEALRHMSERVRVQTTAEPNLATLARTQDPEMIRDWVNTFRHADVVVNLSSTVAVDAALFDKPVVNLDYDPEPGQPNGRLVKDINHCWTHFEPIASSGGVWLTSTPDETLAATKAYLADPSLHRERRRWVAEFVCGFVDGSNGRRMADAITEFASRDSQRAARRSA